MMAQNYHYSATMSPSRIMRKSIFTFLQNLHQLSSVPSLLLLPFVASVLLSPALVASSPLFPSLHARLRSVFLAAGIPPQSELFAVLNLKLSQTILSFAFSLPSSLSFLLIAKAAVIKLLHHKQPQKNSFISLVSTLNRLVATQICNSLLILAANATCFCLLAAAFNCSDVLDLSSPRFRLLLSATGAIAYSIVLANAYIISNLALIASAADDSGGGFSSILEACVLIRGRTSAALSLAVPMNMALAAVESLFQYRVFNSYRREMAVTPPMVLEAALIAYIYAMVLILDTIVGYVFLQNCREEPRDFCYQRIEFFKEMNLKALESVV